MKTMEAVAAREATRFPDAVREDILDQLAEAVRRSGKDEAEVARLAYQASTRIPWRKISEELVVRGAHTFSYSWLFKLGSVWGWWVAKMKYAPEEVFSLPRNKLYIAAANKVGDLSVVAANAHLSDAEFRRMVAGGVEREYYVVNITKTAYETLQRLASRLSAMTGHNLNANAVAEFVIEAADLMSDRMLLELWRAAHGETDGSPD